ncbi:MAG: hypothetical protein SFV51_18845 [Bryobacteraceae bacterium]|nr:hypothetical protein [Bryobacteraceae bacterium]
MPQAYYILLGAALALSACYALGRLLFHRLGLAFHREEELPLALVCGASLLHLIVFTAAAVGVAKKGVFIAMAIAIFAAVWLTGSWRRSSLRFPALPRFWRIALIAAYLAYGVLYWSNAMAPEMSPDGSGYHLGLVAKYLRDRGFTRITTNMYANLTQGIEMLYLFAFSIGRHSAAALVHCGFTMAMPLLILSHARRIGYPAAGAGAAILVLCSPLVGIDGTTAYNDIAVMSVVFALFSLLWIWRSERNAAMLIPIGLLAGYAFACKYTVALAIPYAGAVILWTLLRSGRPSIRPLAVFGSCVALMVIPWLAKNWIIAGNPLSPFLNRFFPNPTVHISFELEYVQMMRRYGEIDRWSQIPLDVTVYGERLAGILGPVFLLAPLALLALRQKEGRPLLLAAAVFFLPYFNNIGARFLLPSLPFLALALAMTLERTHALLPLVVALHMVVSWPHVLKQYCSQYAWRLDRIPIAAALRITPEENFLIDRFPGYSIARMVENAVPPGEKVLTFSGAPEAYTTREIVVAYQGAHNNMLGEIIWVAAFPDSSPTQRIDFRFHKRPLRRIRLWQSAAKGETQWSISELRVLAEAKELPRLPEWRVTAWPNHWEAGLAVDNSLATRWKIWEPLRDGMYFDLDFGQDRHIDAVLIEAVPDQVGVELKLFGQSSSGRWELLSEAPASSDVPQVKGLRRAAVEELRAQGIRYFLAGPDDPGAQDMKVNGGAWGVRKISEYGGVTLYLLEGADSN